METIILYLVVLSLVGACGFLLYMLDKSTKKIELYEEWMIMIRAVSKQTYDAMKAVDNRGAFEADDEIGEAFKTVKFLIEELDKRVVDDEVMIPTSEN